MKRDLGIATLEVVEAIGVPEALSWLKDQGCSKALVETNYLVVVQASGGFHFFIVFADLFYCVGCQVHGLPALTCECNKMLSQL